MISLFAYAIANRLKVGSLLKFVAPYPTLTEMARRVAIEHYRESPGVALDPALAVVHPFVAVSKSGYSLSSWPTSTSRVPDFLTGISARLIATIILVIMVGRGHHLPALGLQFPRQLAEPTSCRSAWWRRACSTSCPTPWRCPKTLTDRLLDRGRRHRHRLPARGPEPADRAHRRAHADGRGDRRHAPRRSARPDRRGARRLVLRLRPHHARRRHRARHRRAGRTADLRGAAARGHDRLFAQHLHPLADRRRHHGGGDLCGAVALADPPDPAADRQHDGLPPRAGERHADHRSRRRAATRSA